MGCSSVMVVVVVLVVRQLCLSVMVVWVAVVGIRGCWGGGWRVRAVLGVMVVLAGWAVTVARAGRRG